MILLLLFLLSIPSVLFAQNPIVTPGQTVAKSARPTACVNPITFALESCGGSGGVGGGLTDAELRATPVPISGTVTATGPLTDAQLRAVPVPISGTVTATGPLTDAQLRATPVPISGTVTTTPPANASTNIVQFGGVNAVTGGLAGSQSVGGTSASDTATVQNPLMIGCEVQAVFANPAAATAGRIRNIACSPEGTLIANLGGNNTFACFVQAVTVTTQCLPAPGAGLRYYITGFSASNQAATAQSLDIVYGTGANCVTGITAVTHKYQTGTLATTTNSVVIAVTYGTPIDSVAINKALCVRPSAATAFGATLVGYIAP